VKTGNRFTELQPIAQGLHTEFGATGADARRGLALRMDHGTQYTADDFLHQIRFWGIAPSFAFVAQPETNGVAERFNRTLKEQAIHGRIFQNVEAVRAAVTDFKDRYNRHWRLEKLGFMSPHEARQAYALQKAA
jgi:transposase InsO family protein